MDTGRILDEYSYIEGLTPIMRETVDVVIIALVIKLLPTQSHIYYPTDLRQMAVAEVLETVEY